MIEMVFPFIVNVFMGLFLFSLYLDNKQVFVLFNGMVL